MSTCPRLQQQGTRQLNGIKGMRMRSRRRNRSRRINSQKLHADGKLAKLGKKILTSQENGLVGRPKTGFFRFQPQLLKKLSTLILTFILPRADSFGGFLSNLVQRHRFDTQNNILESGFDFHVSSLCSTNVPMWERWERDDENLTDFENMKITYSSKAKANQS